MLGFDLSRAATLQVNFPLLSVLGLSSRKLIRSDQEDSPMFIELRTNVT